MTTTSAETNVTDALLQKALAKITSLEQENKLLKGLVHLYEQGYTKAEMEKALRYIEAREFVRQHFGL